MAYRFVPFLMTLKHFTMVLEGHSPVAAVAARQRSKGARSFRGQKILKPGQVTQSPGRRKGLA